MWCIVLYSGWKLESCAKWLGINMKFNKIARIVTLNMRLAGGMSLDFMTLYVATSWQMVSLSSDCLTFIVTSDYLTYCDIVATTWHFLVSLSSDCWHTWRKLKYFSDNKVKFRVQCVSFTILEVIMTSHLTFLMNNTWLFATYEVKKSSCYLTANHSRVRRQNFIPKSSRQLMANRSQVWRQNDIRKVKSALYGEP